MSTTTTIVPTGTWAADTAHSSIGFSVKHLGIATVRGSFGEFEGTLEIGDDLILGFLAGQSRVRSGGLRQLAARSDRLDRGFDPGGLVRHADADQFERNVVNHVCPLGYAFFRSCTDNSG